MVPLLATAWSLPAAPSGASPVVLQLSGGVHVPTDGRLRDLYGAMPSFGAGARIAEQAWGEIEALATVRFASARPPAGPFVEDVTSRWLSIPVWLTVRRRFEAGGLVPFARAGILVQWNRESFDTEIGGDVSEASSSQVRPGLVLAGGLAPRAPDRGLSWFLQGAWQWVPGDRVVETPSGPRKAEGMDLGGFAIHFGLSLR